MRKRQTKKKSSKIHSSCKNCEHIKIARKKHQKRKIRTRRGNRSARRNWNRIDFKLFSKYLNCFRENGIKQKNINEWIRENCGETHN